jgi:hypothetical protein
MNWLAAVGFAFVCGAPVLGILAMTQFGAVARHEKPTDALTLPGYLGVASLLIGAGLILVALPGPSFWSVYGLLQVGLGVALGVFVSRKLQTQRR